MPTPGYQLLPTTSARYCASHFTRSKSSDPDLLVREKRLRGKVTQLVNGKISVYVTSNSRLNTPKSVVSIMKGSQ